MSRFVRMATLRFFALSMISASTVTNAEEIDDELSNALKRFEKKKSSAAAQVLTKFDAYAVQLRRNAPNATAKADGRRRIEQAKTHFRQSGKFLDEPALIGVEIEYYTQVGEAFRAIDSLFEREINKADRQKDFNRMLALTDKRRQVEEGLLGVKAFDNQTVWKGTLHDEKGKSIPYRLTISRADSGGTFDGTVDDNLGVAGNWRYTVHGQARGLFVNYTMMQNLRGRFTAIGAQGFVVGDRLVAAIKQDVGGKPAPEAYIILRR